MASKKERTRDHILTASYELFAKNGFNRVTMKDICEATGLSRGGLYSHFSSTQEVFESVLEKLDQNEVINFHEDINRETSAVSILNRALDLILEEMKHPEDSLSLAMYEYAGAVGNGKMDEFSKSGEEKWTELIEYGILRGEFQKVNTAELVSIILFSYQGVRMWSKIATLESDRIQSIVDHIKRQLLKGEELK